MADRSSVLTVVPGLAACGLFAVSMYVGSWPAFGGAVAGTLACVGAAAVAQSRRERRLRAALEALAGKEEGASAAEGIDGVVADSLRRLAATLAESGAGLRDREAAFAALGHPALFCGPDGTILVASGALAKLLGKTMDKVVGVKAGKAFFGTDKPLLGEDAGLPADGRSETRELTLWDGRRISVDLTAVPIKTGGSPRGMAVTLADVTDRVRQEREVKEQRDRLTQTGAKISDLAEHVASATELLSASADDQAQGAQKQRTQTTAVAEAMEEMTGTVIEVARNASATSEAAGQAQHSAGEGASMVAKAVSAINEVSQSAAQLGKEVGELDARAEEIGRIIGVINDIADQTNLLALNAAIEAARAGDAGRGFAVVADEVRKLAEKTMTATKEVEQAIGTIQERSRHAMVAMRRTEEQVEESTSLARRSPTRRERRCSTSWPASETW